MNQSRVLGGLVLLASTFFALPAAAADRVRAGEWEVALELGGQRVERSMCLSAADAAALNGDAASIRAYAERTNEGTGCKVLDVKVQDDSVAIKTVCSNGRENVGTTRYYGDGQFSETVHTSGNKARAHRVGECK